MKVNISLIHCVHPSPEILMSLVGNHSFQYVVLDVLLFLFHHFVENDFFKY